MDRRWRENLYSKKHLDIVKYFAKLLSTIDSNSSVKSVLYVVRRIDNNFWLDDIPKGIKEYLDQIVKLLKDYDIKTLGDIVSTSRNKWNKMNNDMIENDIRIRDGIKIINFEDEMKRVANLIYPIKIDINNADISMAQLALNDKFPGETLKNIIRRKSIQEIQEIYNDIYHGSVPNAPPAPRPNF